MASNRIGISYYNNICGRISYLFILLTLILSTAAAQESPPASVVRQASRLWKADTTSEFEISTQIRAWTIRDEGMTMILDNMQSMCGINNLYMVAVMHEEYRPFQAPEFPHNPAQDSWSAEDSRVTFEPEWSRYEGLRFKPELSSRPEIQGVDWLKLMVDSCRNRGMAVGAEVSHYPLPKSTIKSNPDIQQRKKDGSTYERFCPNDPDARAYVIALFGDLAANYDLDYIQTCQWLYSGDGYNNDGTCFCDDCKAEAQRLGYDLNVESEWKEFRILSTTLFYKDITDKIKLENPRCQLRINDTFLWNGYWAIETGLDLKALRDDIGSLVNQDHREQNGGSPDFNQRKEWLTENRKLIGPDKPFICGIAPRMKATPELVKTGIKVALEHPARINGICLKHYDGASFGLMRAFKQGMIEAGVQGLTPTIGMEIEDMILQNFTTIDDFVEDWGVETDITGGTASAVFPYESGSYSIRISYFDEDNGQSPVKLFIAEKEVISFKLDEDVDCWRWRLFKKIQIKKGDIIKILGKKDKEERVILDYIEFIPTNSELTKYIH